MAQTIDLLKRPVASGSPDPAIFAITEKSPHGTFGPLGQDHVRMTSCVGVNVTNTAFDRMEARYGT